jgi:hypothetical protein
MTQNNQNQGGQDQQPNQKPGQGGQQKPDQQNQQPGQKPGQGGQQGGQKAAADKTTGATKDTANKQAEPKFDKPLGSSHNDEADLRDVAQEAAKKS